MGFIQLKLPKRIKHKIENSKRNREARARHEAWLKSQGLDDKTLKHKLKDRGGFDLPDLSVKDPDYPKTSDKIPVDGGWKIKPQTYSGERKLIGIGLMHKSNLVPIWDEESAKEISKMRRN